MPNASLYVRLSKQAQATNLSRDGMIAELRALAVSLGARVVAEHVDDGISGAVRDRPEFLAWLDDARSGRADLLVPFHADRLTREGVNAAALVLDVVEGKDPETGRVVRPPVRLVSADGLDSERDAESFRWRFVIAAEVARGERERIRARTKANARRLTLSGRWPGGSPPYGYRATSNPDGPGKVLEVEPEEAEALRWAANEILAGVPLGRVARRLSERGPRPRRAKAWSRVVLRQALTGEHLLGRVTSNGAVVRDEAGRPFAPFPAVLDADTLRAVRRALEPRERRSLGRHPARLLSGLLTCHECGSRLQVSRRSDGSVTYRCPAQSEGRVCPAQVVTSARPVEEHVERLYLRSFGRLPRIERRLVEASSGALADVEDRISALTARLGQQATADTFQALQEAQEERSQILAAPSEEPVEIFVETGRTNSDVWAEADTDARRALLADAYAALVLGPGRRGPRGFDPARLSVLVTPGEDPSLWVE